MSGNDGTIQCMVKEYRRRKGLSQDELARLIGVRRQAVYDMESGRYLPNTAVALKLARVLGCTVEMLFVACVQPDLENVSLLHDAEPSARLSLARVRDRLIGVPLSGRGTLSVKTEAADGFLLSDHTVDCRLPTTQLDKSILILGCDPALNILNGLITRAAPGVHVRTVFASSRRALTSVCEGYAHVAGIHYHSSGPEEGNIEAVRSLSPHMDCVLTTFSLQEEGFMVAAGNPLRIKTIEDIANKHTRFVNREEGAALRKLLDMQLLLHGLPPSEVNGYTEEVYSHNEGAICVASGNADAALGLRIVAEAFGLGFVPIALTRSDVVIPSDLYTHPGVTVLLDILQSANLRKELSSLSGYAATETGTVIL